MGAHAAHTLLSRLYLAAHSSGMPFHAHLQPVCPRGAAQARPVSRHMACSEAYSPLSSMGRKRLRSRAMIPDLHSFNDIHTHGRTGPGVVCSIEPDEPMDGVPGSAWYSVGIHPWSTGHEVPEELFARLEAMVADGRVVAVGEAGLDALRGGPAQRQEAVFMRQAAIAEKTGKPLVVHCVRRYGRLMELHKAFAPRQLWIVHGVRGKPELARQLSAAGIGISLGKPDPAVEAVVPPSLLFRETDGR